MPLPSSRWDWLCVGHHEAGHALLTIEVGRAIERVSIGAADGELGSCVERRPRLAGADALDVLEALRSDILIGYGGILSELKFRGLPTAPGARLDVEAVGGNPDHMRIVERSLAACCGSKNDAAAHRETLRIQAHNILARETVWTQVKAVADALMAWRTLTGAEVLAICAGVNRGSRG